MSKCLVYQWTFDENFIKKAMSKDNVCYKSAGWIDPWNEDANYFFTVYPNGKNEAQKGNFWIYFNLFMRYDKPLKADVTAYISSKKGYKQKFSKVFDTSGCHGILFADHETLLNPKSKFFAGQKFCMIFEVQILNDEKSGDKEIETFLYGKNFLSEKLMLTENKDCIIGVGNQKIAVHQLIIGMFSPIFKAMLEIQVDQEKIIEISDFDYSTVANAINFCYGYLSFEDLNIQDLIELFKFSDKYKMPDLKKEVDYEMLPKMIPANICSVMNGISECEDAEWMKKICADRIKFYLDQKIPEIEDIEVLNQENKNMVFAKIGIPQCEIYNGTTVKCVLGNWFPPSFFHLFHHDNSNLNFGVWVLNIFYVYFIALCEK